MCWCVCFCVHESVYLFVSVCLHQYVCFTTNTHTHTLWPFSAGVPSPCRNCQLSHALNLLLKLKREKSETQHVTCFYIHRVRTMFLHRSQRPVFLLCLDEPVLQTQMCFYKYYNRLNKYPQMFYTSTRKHDGNSYHKSSFVVFGWSRRKWSAATYCTYKQYINANRAQNEYLMYLSGAVCVQLTICSNFQTFTKFKPLIYEHP